MRKNIDWRFPLAVLCFAVLAVTIGCNDVTPPPPLPQAQPTRTYEVPQSSITVVSEGKTHEYPTEEEEVTFTMVMGSDGEKVFVAKTDNIEEMCYKGIVYIFFGGGQPAPKYSKYNKQVVTCEG